MSSRDRVLTDVTELARLIAGAEPPAILDVRWSLDQPHGREAYRVGHIPGAVYVSLEDDLSDHTRDGRGRHPLPSGSDLCATARTWGLRTHQPVVVYDDWNRAGSARAWWALTAAGLTDVRILDGGLSAWTAAGGALEVGETVPRAGDVTPVHDDLYAGARRTLSAEQVSRGQARILLDARSPERFRGEVEPVDPIAGHIPGSRNLPSSSVLTEDGTFLHDAELRAIWANLGTADAGEVGVYCGSGVTAAVILAALSAVGIDAALYPGSWSQWSSEPDRPVARGSA